MKPLSQHRFPYMVISVFLAFIFWLYVIEVEDPERSQVYSNIPVILSGENILENQNLTVTALSRDTVDIVINAPVSTHNTLNNHGITASLDVSKIASEGSFPSSYTLTLPSQVNTNILVIESKNPNQITVDVGKLYSETFSISLQLKGSIAEGYQAGTHTVSPETVTLNGSVDAVSKVDRVVVILDQLNLSDRFSGELPFVMLDVYGNELQDVSIDMSDTSGFVTLPIVMERDIPLVVNLIPGGGADINHVESLTISPSSIRISGDEDDMIGLEEISLGSIDLSLVREDKEFTFPISLDSSLMNVSGTSVATVKVSISGLDTETFDVSNIELINRPDGYICSTATQMRTVVVRGSKEDLAKIDASQLRIVADLSDVSTVGSSSVPVKVYLDFAGDVGVIGEYTIVVNIAPP